MINKLLDWIERVAAYLHGKGGGADNVGKEFSSAISLMEKKVHLCIDIGGNKGIYTDEITAKFPSAKVVILEPAKSNCEF